MANAKESSRRRALPLSSCSRSLFCLAIVVLTLTSLVQSSSSAEKRSRKTKTTPLYTFEGSLYPKDALSECDAQLSGPSGRFAATIHRDASFQFTHVLPGSYSLEIFSQHFVYPQYTVQVGNKISVLESHNRTHLAYPLKARPIATAVWFEPQPAFNPMVYLKNPMVLMLLVGGVLMMVPKLLRYLDPETMAEVEQQQAGGLANLFGAKVKKAYPNKKRN